MSLKNPNFNYGHGGSLTFEQQEYILNNYRDMFVLDMSKQLGLEGYKIRNYLVRHDLPIKQVFNKRRSKQSKVIEGYFNERELSNWLIG